jgi:hypothetical protein
MGRHIPRAIMIPLALFTRPLSKSPNQGAQTTLYCALAPEVAAHGGEYFSDCKVFKQSDSAIDDNVAKKLWEVSEQLTKLV